MDKKRVFIAIQYLEIGGAEISFIGLLQAMDYSKYDVDLFVYSHRGELMQYIPKEVDLLPEIPRYAMLTRPMKQVAKSGHLDLVLSRLLAKRKGQRFAKRHRKGENIAVFQYIADYTTPFLPRINPDVEYDLAISFLIPHNIVRDKVRAKQKWAWIHTDYSFVNLDVKDEFPVWDSYNRIVSISDDVTRGFLIKFPTLENKIIVIHNILSPAFVRQRADEMSSEEVAQEMPREEGVINLLSVGRFCHAKNYDNVPDICKYINSKLCTLNSKLKVRWYLIGYGGDEALIRQRIAEAGMEKNVIILGKKSNPYPYMKACNIYVQPSRYEGNSVTVREAQMLCKPVVVTNYATAPSQVQDGKDGIIVPIENGQCALEIADFIENVNLQASIRSFLSDHDFGNETEIHKIDAYV